LESLGVPTPDLIGPPGIICRRVKLNQRILRFKERGDLEIKDYVVLQKPQTQDNRPPPPHTLISDFTMTHVKFGHSHLHPVGQLTNTRHSDGVPDPDDTLRGEVRFKIRHYRNLYLNRPDPIDLIPLTVDTTGHLYDDFIRLLFLHDHREVSDFDNELTEKSHQFRFLRPVCFANLKVTVGLIMTKEYVMCILIPLDLSYRSFIPLSRFIRSCRPTPFLTPSLVLFPPCSV
jgi:hypothetical protein